MKKLLAILWLTVSFVYAQDQSTPNQITNQWTGISSTSAVPAGCATAGPCPGGPGALYDPNTNTIHFSYGQANVSQTFAINQALANAGVGIQVKGYSYSWDINNLNSDNRQPGTDTLTATINTYNYNNTFIRKSDTWVYNTKFDWTRFSGSVDYINPGPVNEFGNMTVKFTGMDSGYWGGYFGPQVRNVDVRIRYGVDACATDPLSNVSCSGYAQAWLNLQCSGNPLYSPQCPGYAQAYFTQQCTVNALSDPSCPGYANAYLTYQCSVNPLYATTCVGYEQAYFNQQCEQNQLYSQLCPGYNQAYALKNIIAQPSKVQQTQQVENSSTPELVAVVSDPIVNNVITTSNTVTTAAVSTVPLVTTGVSNVSTASVSTPSINSTPPTENKVSSARQELAAKREAQAKAQAVEKGKNLANDMGKVADMESQKQIQNVVIQAMGFTPGFDAYNVKIHDVPGYKPFTVYGNQKNVDNAKLGRRMFGPTEQLHDDLVKMQFDIK